MDAIHVLCKTAFFLKNTRFVSEALNSDVPVHWMIPVETYSLYRSVQSIYSYTHLFKYPFTSREPGYYVK